MPKYARPAHSESVEAAIEAFGNRVRVAILGALRQHGPATRGELAARIGSAEKTVQTHLRTLEGLGLVSSDPPPESRKSGQRVRYSANAPEIDTCLATLVSAVQGRTD
jgi:DNA-binding transcriptional ArsR family regulator